MTSIRTALWATVLAVVVAGCAAPSSDASPSGGAGGSGSGRMGIDGVATAGPVCPVERTPPDPRCAPRPVADAVLIVRDAAGLEIGRARTATDGTFFVAVPAGGYVVEPQPVEGLLGTAPPQTVTVGAGATVTIAIDYDTGIR
jgi:hypothetical protein